jgi:2-(1,2-epoxy-1,2-dihydrophenyl)acetyl-CoA isomerase
MSDKLLVERRGEVDLITINRPEMRNALDFETYDLLEAAVRATTARCLVITGTDPAFCSGDDVRAVMAGGEKRDKPVITTPRLTPAADAILHTNVPVVAAVNGAAAGIGLSLALACDLVVAAESAYFLLAFVNIGLVPDGGSSLLVPTRVGFARAAEMAMLGERVPAAQALAWGLVNRVVPDDDLAGAGDVLLQLSANGPTTSYAGSKRLLNRRMYAGLVEQLEAEADAQREQGKSPDFIEGVLAFAEKRPPNFTGK